MTNGYLKISQFVKAGFKEMKEGFKEMKEDFKEMKEDFKEVNRRLENLEMAVAQHENTLKTLVTRDEFNEFRKENLETHESLATSLEKLDQEFLCSTGAQDRLKKRVDVHEKVLIKNKLLTVSA